MSKRRGSDAFLGIGKETTWSTAVARTAFLEYSAESGGFNPGRQTIPTWRGRIDPAMYDSGSRVTKSFTVPFTYTGLEEILRAGLWGYAGGGSLAAGGFTHTFTLGTTLPASLTLEGGNSEANSAIWAGQMVKKVAFEMAASDLGKFSFDTVGPTEAFATKSVSPTYPDLTTQLVQAAHIITKLGTSPATGAAFDADSFSLSYETGIDDGQVKLRGSSAIIQPDVADKGKLTGSFTRDYSANDEYTKYVDGTVENIVADAQGGPIPGAGASTTFAIASSTNASPIVVTSAAHSYTTGDKVQISGHTTNTAANGTWTIIVLSGTTFSLNGSTGNGVGGATGNVIKNAYRCRITLPSCVITGEPFSHTGPGVSKETISFQAINVGTPCTILIVNATAILL